MERRLHKTQQKKIPMHIKQDLFISKKYRKAKTDILIENVHSCLLHNAVSIDCSENLSSYKIHYI